MPLETTIWKDGTVHTSPKQKCDVCDKPITPIWKDSPVDPSTWFWAECHFCDEPVCEECSDIDDGVRTCVICIQNTASIG